MATVSRFEDLEVWQLARQQCRSVHAMMQAGVFKNEPDLLRQIKRASGSVMDNIAEGFDRFSRPDFKHFLVIARASNAETRSQLYRTADCTAIAEEQLRPLHKASVNLSVKLSNFITHLHNTNYKSKKPPGHGGDLHEPDTSYRSSEVAEYILPAEFIIDTPTN